VVEGLDPEPDRPRIVADDDPIRFGRPEEGGGLPESLVASAPDGPPLDPASGPVMGAPPGPGAVAEVEPPSTGGGPPGAPPDPMLSWVGWEPPPG
jgi:hypothetical protein